MTNEPDDDRADELPAVIHLPDLNPRPRVKPYRSGSEKRQRTQAIRVRVHPADGERLKREALEAGMSVAGYLASGRLGSEAPPRPRFRRRRTTVDEVALSKAFVGFIRATNNLNQIARALNALVLAVEQQRIGGDRLLDEMRELRRPIELLEQQFATPFAEIKSALYPLADRD